MIYALCGIAIVCLFVYAMCRAAQIGDEYFNEMEKELHVKHLQDINRKPK